MGCISPPELDGVQLLMHLDGAAEPSVADHLAACAHCRERAARLGRIEARLLAALYRRACPEPQALGEYRLGMLPRREAAGIAHHVAECPHCARELAQLQSFLGEMAPAEQGLAAAAGRIRVLVAQLAGGLAGALSAPQPAFAPASAGVRGEMPGPAVFRAEEIQVLLAAQQSEADASRYELLGLLTGAEPAGFTASLWREGRLLASAAVDEGGNFTLHSLPPGPYELVLAGPAEEVYIEKLEI